MNAMPRRCIQCFGIWPQWMEFSHTPMWEPNLFNRITRKTFCKSNQSSVNDVGLTKINWVWTIQVFWDGSYSQHHTRDLHPEFYQCQNLKSQFTLLPVSDITQDCLIRLVNYDDIQLYTTDRLYDKHIQGIKIVIMLTTDCTLAMYGVKRLVSRPVAV